MFTFNVLAAQNKNNTITADNRYVYIDEKSINKFKESTVHMSIDYTEYLGAYNLIYARFGEDQFIAKVSDRSQIEATELDFAFDMEKAHFFDVETTKRIR